MKLNIDHFYVSLPSPVFRQLAKIAKDNDSFQHQVVKSGEDTWEGIYLGTKSSIYLEFLKPDENVKINYTGLALSSLFRKLKENEINKELRGENPQIFWDDGHRLDKNNKKWFRYWYDLRYNPGFKLWVMHYYGQNAQKRNKKMGESSIQSIESFSITLPARKFEAMERGLHWCPVDCKVGSKTIRISDEKVSLHVKKGDSLEVKIKLKLAKKASFTPWVGSRASFRLRGDYAYLSLK